MYSKDALNKLDEISSMVPRRKRAKDYESIRELNDLEYFLKEKYDYQEATYLSAHKALTDIDIKHPGDMIMKERVRAIRKLLIQTQYRLQGNSEINFNSSPPLQNVENAKCNTDAEVQLQVQG
jgi:hypothetical protein